MKGSIAVCPGSFDPVTVGHLDIIRRAAGMFSELIVVVMVNHKKKYSFTPDERVALIKAVTGDLPNVKVEYYDGLLADFARQKGAGVIIKGLRAMSDFEYEFQMALANKKLNPDVETVFLTTAAENMYLSSSMVKQIASMGGDIKDFVPEQIKKDITERLYGKDE
ncbi:MAG: pantetheine-phosphate adenylyltransferase [Clostridia bacterium]|nr:pantetheine-phosphate adenylyltransferase [Clostridia bacterium]MBQ5798208.1 pantetheine-phosphate adenylyltransferase [Clostridia bacterium]MBQ5900754.1 pantetheine-phosphate adenylyltransferase [Clostridia bacterium]